MFDFSKLSAALSCAALICGATDVRAQTSEAPEPEAAEEEASDGARLFPEYGLQLMGARYSGSYSVRALHHAGADGADQCPVVLGTDLCTY